MRLVAILKCTVVSVGCKLSIGGNNVVLHIVKNHVVCMLLTFVAKNGHVPKVGKKTCLLRKVNKVFYMP